MVYNATPQAPAAGSTLVNGLLTLAGTDLTPGIYLVEELDAAGTVIARGWYEQRAAGTGDVDLSGYLALTGTATGSPMTGNQEFWEDTGIVFAGANGDSRYYLYNSGGVLRIFDLTGGGIYTFDQGRFTLGNASYQVTLGCGPTGGLLSDGEPVLTGAKVNLLDLTTDQMDEVLALPYVDCDAAPAASPAWSCPEMKFDALYQGNNCHFYCSRGTYDPADPTTGSGPAWHYFQKLG